MSARWALTSLRGFGEVAVWRTGRRIPVRPSRPLGGIFGSRGSPDGWRTVPLSRSRTSPSPAATRFLNGTPQRPRASRCRTGYEIVATVGVPAIRAKSIRQTQRLIELADAAHIPVAAPRDPSHCGGTITLEVPNGLRVTRVLADRDVLVDFRPGAGIRVSPHFYTATELVTFFEELDRASTTTRLAPGGKSRRLRTEGRSPATRPRRDPGVVSQRLDSRQFVGRARSRFSESANSSSPPRLEPPMREAIEAFEQDFAQWDLHLPADAITTKRGGQIRDAGWSIRYNFGTDARGEYLDYYATGHEVVDNPPGDDLHVRIYASGERVALPTVLEAYMYGRLTPHGELERARCNMRTNSGGPRRRPRRPAASPPRQSL